MHFFTDKTMLPDTKKLKNLLLCTLWNQQGGVKVKSNNYIWKYYRERRKWKNSVFKTYKNSLRRQRQKSYYLHIFLVLEWNLMKRDENFVGEKNHISIRVDSLVFEFAKSKIISKGNSTWDRVTRTITHRIHTYAHFLRLLDNFYFSRIHEKVTPLFEGTRQYEIYSKIFHDVLVENEDEFQALGIKKGDLGTHYCQKGVATIVASVCTVSPPIVSIWIWCRW